MSGVVIIGAGGHGRVVASVLQAAGRNVAGFIDSSKPDGLPFDVLGNDNDVDRLFKAGDFDSFIIGIGSVNGGTALRKTLFAKMTDLGVAPAVAIHPSALLSPGVKIGAGSVIMAGAIINSDAQVSKNCIINTGAILDHDCAIGDHVHIAPGVTLSGNVKVGENSLIGVGSTVRQSITIGRDVTIGAGSVVISNISDDLTAYGNPAKPV